MRTLYLGLAFILCGCGAERGDYAKAQSAGTASAYADFLSKYPSTSRKVEAEKSRDAALVREASESGSPSALLSFMKSHSQWDPKAIEARRSCAELLLQGK